MLATAVGLARREGLPLPIPATVVLPAVEAAAGWGTYVATHAYTPNAIQRSIAAGVKVIEHGHLMDEATARLMAEKGIWLSTQPFLDLGGAAVTLSATESVNARPSPLRSSLRYPSR